MLHKDNDDAAIWLDSYREEYQDLKHMNVYEEITQEDFKKNSTQKWQTTAYNVCFNDKI